MKKKKQQTVADVATLEQQAVINAVVGIIWAKAEKRQLLDGKCPEKHKSKKRELLALVYSEPNLAALIADSQWLLELSEKSKREAGIQ
jgi:hypothetical protein